MELFTIEASLRAETIKAILCSEDKMLKQFKIYKVEYIIAEKFTVSSTFLEQQSIRAHSTMSNYS